MRLWGSRFAYCMFIFSFFLPFVTVQQCSTKEPVSYPGTDLIDGFRGLFYLIPMVLFFGYFILSFFKKRVSGSLDTFLQSWKAISAAGSGLIVGFLPSFDYLLQKVHPQIGQVLAMLSCLWIYFDSMFASAIALIRFAKEPQMADQRTSLSRMMEAVHFAMLFLPCFLIFYVSSRGGGFFSLFVIVFLMMPFLLLEGITLYALKRHQRWTYVWSSVLLIGICVSVFIYIFR